MAPVIDPEQDEVNPKAYPLAKPDMAVTIVREKNQNWKSSQILTNICSKRPKSHYLRPFFQNLFKHFIDFVIFDFVKFL